MSFEITELEHVLEGDVEDAFLSANIVRNPDYGKVEGADYFLKNEDGSYKYSDFEPTEPEGWYDLGGNKVVLNGETYDVKEIESHGGGEGSGEYTYVVLEVGGRLFRKEGYYASHYGTTWDGDFEEVESYEKTVTDYRKI